MSVKHTGESRPLVISMSGIGGLPSALLFYHSPECKNLEGRNL